MNKRVLVIGGGIGGMESALTLAKSGIDVLLVEKENNLGGIIRKLNSFYQGGLSPSELLEKMKDEISKSASIEVFLNSKIFKIKGCVGDFAVKIMGNNMTMNLNFGAIVFATGFICRYPQSAYRIDRNDSIVTFLELEKMILEGKIPDIPKKVGKKPIVLFITGFAGENVLSISSTLKNALILAKEYGYRVFAASRQMKVDSYGLEKMYGNARENGVIFFRFQDKTPLIQIDNGKPLVYLSDYQLSTSKTTNPKVRIPCDLLILDEEYLPAEDSPMFDFNLEIKRDDKGFYQQDNVYLFPVTTNRKGIFAVGGCRFIGTIGSVINDARSAAAIITSLLKEKNIYESKEVIKVDPGKCALCMTCQRFCPHGAITYDRVPIFSPADCQICGVCVKECPNNALTVVDKDRAEHYISNIVI
ncbi:FAD-dependent oxidoreductase [bacterium]|nr:FAD-dependent oxidoreductase [bacterium]